MRQSGDRRRLAKVIARFIGLTPSARRWHAVLALLLVVILTAAHSVWSDRKRDVEAKQGHARQLAARAAQVAAKQAAVAHARADQERAKADFAAKRPELIAAMRAALKRSDFAGVQRIGSPYLTYADAEFRGVFDKAHAAQAAIDAKAEAKAEAEQRKRELAERRSQGVSIGMTEERVLQSSWGKPDSVNRTITANVVHEQWVYDSRVSGYLYFDNGILTGIQN